jgi:hypothetical protein
MTNKLSNIHLDEHGNLTQHFEKEDVFVMLADSMPTNIQLKDALYGGLLFVADIIHQIDPNNEKNILEISKGLLECDYHIIKRKFSKQ